MRSLKCVEFEVEVWKPPPPKFKTFFTAFNLKNSPFEDLNEDAHSLLLIQQTFLFYFVCRSSSWTVMFLIHYEVLSNQPAVRVRVNRSRLPSVRLLILAHIYPAPVPKTKGKFAVRTFW